MKARDKRLSQISLIIFFIGAIIGMTILGIAVMGDLEALMFKPSVDGETAITTLKCPVIMAYSETGKITITLSNPTDSRISPSVWTHISEGFVTLIREERENLFLEPGESQQVQWTITGDEAVFGGRWVLIKTKIYSQYPLPSGIGSCGVFVANLESITGEQVYISSLATSILLMGIGGGILNLKPAIKGGDKNRARSTLVMGIIVSIGLITITLGSYLLFVSGITFILGALGLPTFFLYDKAKSV